MEKERSKEGINLIIGFDIDGVIAQIDLATIRLIDFVQDDKGRENVENYYFAHRPVDLNSNLFRNFEGDKIILVTSRPMKYKQLTIDWLDKHGIKYDKLIMLDHSLPTGLTGKELVEWFNGQAEKKANSLKENNIEVYFEDTPHTVKKLRELCPNIRIILYGYRSLKYQ